jgi:hypothetical protein
MWIAVSVGSGVVCFCACIGGIIALLLGLKVLKDIAVRSERGVDSPLCALVFFA